MPKRYEIDVFAIRSLEGARGDYGQLRPGEDGAWLGSLQQTQGASLIGDKAS